MAIEPEVGFKSQGQTLVTHAGLHTSLVQPTVDVRPFLEELERVGLTAYDAHLDWVASAVMHLAGIIRAKTEALTAEESRMTLVSPHDGILADF